MKKFLFGVSIAATAGTFIADMLVQRMPAFRNGWWSLLFFLAPLAAIVLAWSPDQKGKLGGSAVAVFALGLGGYIASRTLLGNVSGQPAVAVGDKAPDFTLKDSAGKDVSLSDMMSGRPVVLIFFRGNR